MISQEILNLECTKLRALYKNKIQEITLEYCTDDKGEYINWNVLRIKKSQQNLGYGSLVMSEIIHIADNENVRVRLMPTNLWGSDICRLREFCQKHGFIVDNKDKDRMMYYPKKV